MNCSKFTDFGLCVKTELLRTGKEQKWLEEAIAEKTGIEEKYVGKTARAVENIDKNNGVITIYDERWQARNIENETIEAGQTVEIVGYDSLIMKIKKID